MSDVKDDGGAAFPQHIAEGPSGDLWASYNFEDGAGMSLRDYFAAKAMQGLMSAHDTQGTWSTNDCEDDIASRSYGMADAMLKARGEHHG